MSGEVGEGWSVKNNEDFGGHGGHYLAPCPYTCAQSYHPADNMASMAKDKMHK